MDSTNVKRVIVIGGGAAGLLCGYFAAVNGASVKIIEKNTRPGRKILISGKGRCNITNNCDVRRFMENVVVNANFLYSALNFLSPDELMNLMENNGLPLKTERGNRVFPVSDKAMDVVDTLHKMVIDAGCQFINETVIDVIFENSVAVAVKTNKTVYDAESIVIATGGASYSRTGSTGDGYKFARKLGHTIVPIKPSLVPLVTEGKTAQKLMGLSLKNVSLRINCAENGKQIYSDFGEMIFTHFGISGPMVLSASSHLDDGFKYNAYIDLKPALNEEELSSRIVRDFASAPNKDYANSLDELLPKKLIPVVVDFSGIDPRKKANSVTKDERKRLAALLKNFPITIIGKRPIEEAIITSGGVSVKEINPKTMMSKLVGNLYFAGEVMDVDALTGGFNMHIAMSTGALAGYSCAKS